MSSVICQNFVQNAWKKELCSNCFKSKDEHISLSKPKPLQFVSKEKVEGIIKTTKRDKKLTVGFTKNLTEVIGYGGEDWLSDEDHETEETDDVLIEEITSDSDEDESVKELRRITKENTDYNTVSLGEIVEIKRSYTQLMLGKPILGADGKKQTLQVSVTPFGEEPTNKKYTLSKVNKEPVAETKSSVILTSYTKNEENKQEKSLLDEISETLEKNNSSIQIVTKKKTQKDIILNVESNKENIHKESKKEADEKSERRVSLTRTPALIKKDGEKPVYQTSTAKIELMNTKNIRLSRENLNGKVTPEINNNCTNSDQEKLNEQLVNAIITTANFIRIERLNTRETNEEHPELPKKLKSLRPVVQKYPLNDREQAGKPDGREDPATTNELPALPLTPPPVLETQTSFLHNTPIYEKPKVPSKPVNVLIRKPIMTTTNSIVSSKPLTTFTKPPLVKQDSAGSDVKVNKRQAPKPPDEPLYTKNCTAPIKSDSPVVREKEKRERASSCVPKMCVVPSNAAGEAEYVPPEPAPRKSLSISTDNLAHGDEKRKDKTRGRFSLKKFLRMGSSKDLNKTNSDASSSEGSTEAPQPKPRLVIVHPTELNGEKVEVVPKQSPDQIDNPPSTPVTTKPPPPPRNYESLNKPLSHPPKSMEVVTKQRQQITRTNSGPKKTETVYANIGEVRSSIVPNKPVRTASMREREAQQQKQMMRKHHYEPVNVVNKSTENVYEYVNSTPRSSSPDSDSSRDKNSPKTKTARLGKRSESNIDVSNEYFKFGNIPRSMSLTYCGSETESEIYSPYSFYGSESEVAEDDHEWPQNGRTHKLRSRKGRSIVHKNLEDNYGAVVVANHEALAQVLENIQQIVHVQPALRGLKMAANLRLSDFTLSPTAAPLLRVGRRAFHQALWGAHHVTLVMTAAASAGSALSLGAPFSLNPVTEFSDLVPARLMGDTGDGEKPVQATMSVLPWLQVHTIPSYAEVLKTKAAQNIEEAYKDASFAMLQLVNALKTLQAQGIEELPLSLDSFVLCKEVERETNYRLCVLQSLSSDLTPSHEDKYGSLCMCALKALTNLQLSPKIMPLIHSLLTNERAVSLTQVKSILEFSLWGPTDVSLGSSVRERELALQRWLDLQRATVLHGLVCTRVQLTVYEECHLLFLVRSSARMMCDASMLIESSNAKYLHSSKA